MDFAAESDRFLSWLQKSGGATISNKIALVDMRATGAGRGVVATADIEAEDVLFEIPRGIVLSVENSDISSQLPGVLDDLDAWLSLVVVLIYEYLKTPDTPWRPYFQILPNHFDTLIYWSEAELAELQGSAVVQKIGKGDADKLFKEHVVPILRNHSQLFPLPPGVTSYDGEDGQSAILAMAHTMATLVMAYGFDLERDEATKERDDEGFMSDEDEDALPKGMVPLADLLNADAERNNARLFYGEKSLVMRSLVSIKKGEEVLNDYGPLPRSDLLRRYGYVTSGYAQYDVVELSTEMLSHVVTECTGRARADMDARLLEVADRIGLTDGYDLTHPYATHSAIPEELLTLIASLLSDDGHCSRNGTGNRSSRPEITREIALVLRKTILRKQEEYATTLAQDQALLRDFSIGGRYRMAVEVRLGEKLILKEAREEVETLLASTSNIDQGNNRMPTKRGAEQCLETLSKKSRRS